MMESTSTSNDKCYGENNCVLCKKTFDYSCEKVRVGDKGLENILANSVKRDDVNLTSYFKLKPSVVYVHAKCRKD